MSPSVGEIDVLIGMQYAAYQPNRKACHGNLVLLENQFGMLVAGSFNDSNEQSIIDKSVLHIRHGVVMHTAHNMERFFEIEGLGVSCNPRCGSCKCGKCHSGGKNMSLQEEREYDKMKLNVSFDSTTGRFISSYPWNVNLNKAYSIDH